MELILHTNVAKHEKIQEATKVKLIFKQHFLNRIKYKILYFMFTFIKNNVKDITAHEHMYFKPFK